MHLIFKLLFLIAFIGCSTSSAPSSSSTYPDISTFNTSRSNQFIVDMDVVADGHMYRGEACSNPHTGAHVHFPNNSGESPPYPNGTAVTDYPKIYAFADGKVSKIDRYYEVTNPEKTHYRYGIIIEFASSSGETISMSYSIEPMIDPGDESFYSDYITVSIGDVVKKGDVIAYMYLSTDADVGTGHHIHFNLIKNSAMQAPALFTSTIMTDFVDKISTSNGGVRNFDGDKNTGTWMGDCMGYKIAAGENPYENAAADCLK